MNPMDTLPEGQQAVLLYEVPEGFLPVVGDWVDAATAPRGIPTPSGRCYFITVPYTELMDELKLWAVDPAGWFVLP